MYRIFLNDRVIMLAILVNMVMLFLLSFDQLSDYFATYRLIDQGLTLFFLLEAIVKIHVRGWQTYIRSGWNRLDFAIVVLTTPTLFFYLFDISDTSFLLIFRLLRLAKFFRFFQFVPHLDKIFKGVLRSLKASVFMMLALLLYGLIASLFNCYLFRDLAPEHFGNALKALYTTFRMFTMEGWYDIPEALMHQQESSTLHFFVRFYFVLIVITGGVFGLSIVNAIFVDEMLSDNNQDLEKRIQHLEDQIDQAIEHL